MLWANFYQLILNNETCVALAYLRRSMNKYWKWTSCDLVWLSNVHVCWLLSWIHMQVLLFAFTIECGVVDSIWWRDPIFFSSIMCLYGVRCLILASPVANQIEMSTWKKNPNNPQTLLNIVLTTHSMPPYYTDCINRDIEMSASMLEQLISECPLDAWLSIIDINNGSKESTCGYQSCNTSQMLACRWISQGERIFVYSSYYLGQYLSKPYW